MTWLGAGGLRVRNRARCQALLSSRTMAGSSALVPLLLRAVLRWKRRRYPLPRSPVYSLTWAPPEILLSDAFPEAA